VVVLGSRAQVVIPGGADFFQHGGIDNPSSEGIDQGHVERGNPGSLAHVDREVEAIAIGAFREGGEGRGMDGAILYFKQLLVLEAIEDAEHSVRRSRRDRRAGAILCYKAAGKRSCRSILRFGFQAENASKKEAKTEERAGHGREFCNLRVGADLTGAAKEFGEGNAAVVRRQVNSPDVVQRDAGEEGMHAKRERVKLGWGDLRHLLFVVPIL
jgi:hypothetical protein